MVSRARERECFHREKKEVERTRVNKESLDFPLAEFLPQTVLARKGESGLLPLWLCCCYGA